MAQYKVDETCGTLSIKKSGNTVTLNHGDFLEILAHTDNDELMLSSGVRFRMDNGEYRFETLVYDFTIRTFVYLTKHEFSTALDYATDISPPALHQDICTLCDKYIGVGDVHYGCPCNKDKMKLFSQLFFGAKLLSIITDMVLDSSYDDMKYAYAAVKREDVLNRISLDVAILCKVGPVPFQNEKILSRDSYFKNFKLCAIDTVYGRIFSA